MIANEISGIAAVLIESIGILITERKTAMILTLATILTIIIFFMI